MVGPGRTQCGVDASKGPDFQLLECSYKDGIGLQQQIHLRRFHPRTGGRRRGEVDNSPPAREHAQPFIEEARSTLSVEYHAPQAGGLEGQSDTDLHAGHSGLLGKRSKHRVNREDLDPFDHRRQPRGMTHMGSRQQEETGSLPYPEQCGDLETRRGIPFDLPAQAFPFPEISPPGRGTGAFPTGLTGRRAQVGESVLDRIPVAAIRATKKSPVHTSILHPVRHENQTEAGPAAGTLHPVRDE